jgi:hypothetical protein
MREDYIAEIQGMKIQSKITHRRQQLPYSCGAASIAMLFGADEKTIRKEVKTRASGTNTDLVCDFLSRQGLKYHWVCINEDYYNAMPNLARTSFQYPIYACGSFRDRFFLNGRDRNRNHAVLICDGLVFDPSEEREMSGEAYEKVFNKSLVFNTLIIIEEERPNFLRNSLQTGEWAA